jgi:peroxiredoxin
MLLLNKLIYAFYRARLKQVLALLVFSQNCFYSQLNIIDSVCIRAKEKYVSYDFINIHSWDNKDTITIKGQAYLLRKPKNKIEFRIVENGIREFINYDKLTGYNILENDTYLDCSKNLLELNNKITDLDNYMFSRDSIKNYFFNKPDKYKVSCTNEATNYVLIIESVMPRMTDDGLATIKSLATKFTISKNDFRIIAYTQKICLSFNDVIQMYSSEIRYLYHKTSEKEIKKRLDSFIPNRKIITSNRFPKSFIDTTTFFPHFQLPDSSLASFDSKSCHSKFVLIEFWYRGCAPCLANIKELKEISQAFNKTDLQVLAINDVDQYSNELNSFLKRNSINYKALFNGGELAKKLNINAHPCTFIYETQTRKIILHKLGGGQGYADEIKGFLNDILGY